MAQCTKPAIIVTVVGAVYLLLSLGPLIAGGGIAKHFLDNALGTSAKEHTLKCEVGLKSGIDVMLDAGDAADDFEKVGECLTQYGQTSVTFTKEGASNPEPIHFAQNCTAAWASDHDLIEVGSFLFKYDGDDCVAGEYKVISSDKPVYVVDMNKVTGGIWAAIFGTMGAIAICIGGWICCCAGGIVALCAQPQSRMVAQAGVPFTQP